MAAQCFSDLVRTVMVMAKVLFYAFRLHKACCEKLLFTINFFVLVKEEAVAQGMLSSLTGMVTKFYEP